MPTPTYTIKLRRGTAAEWAAANPILAEGEEGFETDTRKSKHGDGVTAWNDLSYDAAGDPNAMISSPGALVYTYDTVEPGAPVDGDIWTNPEDDPPPGFEPPDLSAYATTAYVDSEIDDIEALIEASGGSFRGAWAAFAVLATYSFSDGIMPSTSPFAQTHAEPFGDGTTRFQNVAIGTTPATGRPSVARALQLHQGNYQSGHYTMLSLSLAAVAAATGKTPTKVRSYVAKVEGSNGSLVTASERVGGSNIRTNAPASNWQQYTDDVTATSTYDWLLQGTDINNSCSVDLFVANVEVLGTQDPYMFNEFVTYNNKIYQSNVDNNTSTPGADSNWSMILDGDGSSVDLSEYASKHKAVNAQTASYTLVLGDDGKWIEVSNASACTLTVPPNSSVAFPVGTQIEGMQTGAGQLTLTPGSGVTINGAPGLKVASQYGVFGLVKVDTDTWRAYGRLSA